MQTPDPRNLISAILLCFLTWVGSLYPQSAWSQDVQTEENTEDVVRRIRFSGNEDIKDRTLTTLVRTRTNREFLSIPQFTPWYTIWKISGGRFGEEPAYLDRQTVGNDIERITLYYESLGYFDVGVDTTIVEYRTDKIEVSFIIDEGPQYRINSVAYSGFPGFTDDQCLHAKGTGIDINR